MNISPEKRTQEGNLSFEVLEKRLQAYLSDPKSGNPSSDLNDYFGGINDPEEVVTKTHSLLFDTRHRLLNPQSSDLDPAYGNPGTIVMRLPYFYPLHLTLFSWYVGASLKTAQKLNDRDKEILVEKIRKEASINGLIPDEVRRLEDRLDSFASSEIKATVPTPGKPLPWYRNLNPFKK